MIQLFNKEIDTVLFDKDGTLIDLPSIWIPWAMDAIQYIAATFSSIQALTPLFERDFGFSAENGTVNPKGPLVVTSFRESETIIASILYKSGMSWADAVLLAGESIHYASKLQDQSSKIQLVQGIEPILRNLKDKKVTLGVLTTDDTERSRNHLKETGIYNYFDFVIGGDIVEKSKPYPDMAFLAADTYKLDLSKAAMIGDTNADMLLGKAANIQLKIGFGNNQKNPASYLTASDYIIDSYKELLTII